MDFKFLILIAFAGGGAVGYLIREIISRRRREKARTSFEYPE